MAEVTKPILLDETGKEIKDAILMVKTAIENQSGSASVTAESIKAALGYTPADDNDVRQLSEEIADKNFRYIATMENTVDNTVTNISVDVDSNGNPFSLDEICMISYCPQAASGQNTQLYFGFQLNPNEFFFATNFMSPSEERSSVIYVLRKPNGDMLAQMFSQKKGNEWITGTTNSNFTVGTHFGTTDKIEKVQLYTPGGLPVGAKVEVYGRDSV